MIGNCDTCDRKNVPVSQVNVPGEPVACFICQGDTDPDPYCELGHDQDGKLIEVGENQWSASCAKCGAVLHADDPKPGDWCLDCEMVRAPTPLEAAKKLLINASVGSCTCNTKTPELMWHAPNCRFVLIMMALENVEIAASSSLTSNDSPTPLEGK